MRLLIVTQALDLDDPLLSAYHGWVEALAKDVDHVEAICLKEGRHALPSNVTVHSLGKERGTTSSLQYALRFLALAWRLRTSYDAVFVHMNQEYVLVAGPLWKLLGKRVFMWRNHYAGSLLTDIAAAFCTNVFCTSQYSYTAKFKKTVYMPVGVHTGRFKNTGTDIRVPRSILFFSRIAPSKHAELLIQALNILRNRGISFSASIVGSAPPEFKEYADSLMELVQSYALEEMVTFVPGIPNEEAPKVYQTHELFVNCSPSGMLDKMIFEAAASGCFILSESKDLKRMGFEDVTYESGSVESLANHIEKLLSLEEVERAEILKRLSVLVEQNSLSGLAGKLTEYMRQSRK